MKITGIDIEDYQQFKDIKFDFTYPEGHELAGQPLKKVCFIGQSGTGKTTLLRVLNSHFELLSYIYAGNSSTRIKALSKNIFGLLSKISISNILQNVEFKIDFELSKSLPTLIDLKNLLDKEESIFLLINDDFVSHAEKLKDDKIFDFHNNSSVIATTEEIEQIKKNKEKDIELFRNAKFFHEGVTRTPVFWASILIGIEEYQEKFKVLLQEVLSNKVSPDKISKKIEEWRKENPNPRTELAEKCLNPILNKFFLEVDTENDEAPIVIKKLKSDQKIGFYGLSTGTKQILTTALPIYKLGKDAPVILFDEPERSLFPDLQRTIIDYYTGLAPDSQFFFATHSPIIASAFEPCERFILYFDDEGNVRCRNGVAPVGASPNDMLTEDFEMNPLLTPKGVEKYQEYRQLGTQIINEKDPQKKETLISKRMRLGNEYNF